MGGTGSCTVGERYVGAGSDAGKSPGCSGATSRQSAGISATPSGRRGPAVAFFDSCPRRCSRERDGALFTERGTGASRKQRGTPPLSSARMPGPEAGTARVLPGKEMRARPPEQSGPLKPCGFAIRVNYPRARPSVKDSINLSPATAGLLGGRLASLSRPSW